MIVAFLFFLLSLGLPALVNTIWLKGRDNRPFFVFPTALALQVFFSGASAAIASRYLAFGILSYAIVVLVGLLLSAVTLRRISWPSRLVKQEWAQWKPLLWLLAIAFLSCAELGVIFHANDWGVPEGETYFRPPLHNDSYRNLVLVEALGRGNASPFLAGSKLLYQTFWHTLAGTFLFPFQSISRLSIVSGAAWATGLLFFFLGLWACVILRPQLFTKRRFLWVLLLLLMTTHTDIYHFFASLLFQGRLGIEADWSVKSRFFRMFSLKLITLSSPQHAIFFIFFSVLMAWRRLSYRKGPEPIWWMACILVSPLLSFFSLPWVFAWDLWRSREKKQFIISRVILLCGVALIYWPMTGKPVWALFGRGSQTSMEFFPWYPEVLAQLPLFLIASVGVIGILASVVGIHRFQRLGKAAWNLELLLLIGGASLFLFFFDHPEVRRHYSMLASLVAVFLCVKSLPLDPNEKWLRWCRAPILFSVILLHSYFLYCYLLKPSKVDPEIAWKDYFGMNEVVKKKYSGYPILAAVDPWNLGLEMPVVMEVTTSFSLVEHAAIHSEIASEKFSQLLWVRQLRNILPVAESFGYHLVLWGPVEERVWGRKARERFLSHEGPLETYGAVSLYRLEDRLMNSVRPELSQPKPNYFSVANRFEAAGWDLEALGYYERALSQSPKSIEPAVAVGRLYLNHGNAKEAKRVSDYLLQHHSESAQSWFIRGKSLLQLGDARQALEAFQKGNALDPKYLEIYVPAIEILLKAGEWNPANHLLTEALKLSKGHPEALSLLLIKARILQSQNQSAQAKEVLETVRKLSEKEGQRNDVDLALGDLYFSQKDLTLARSYYERVLDRDSDEVNALLRMGMLQWEVGQRKDAIANLHAVLRRDHMNEQAHRALEMMGVRERW